MVTFNEYIMGFQAPTAVSCAGCAGILCEPSHSFMLSLSFCWGSLLVLKGLVVIVLLLELGDPFAGTGTEHGHLWTLNISTYTAVDMSM